MASAPSVSHEDYATEPVTRSYRGFSPPRSSSSFSLLFKVIKQKWLDLEERINSFDLAMERRWRHLLETI